MPFAQNNGNIDLCPFSARSVCLQCFLHIQRQDQDRVFQVRTICEHIVTECSLNGIDVLTEITNPDNLDLCTMCPIYRSCRSSDDCLSSNVSHLKQFAHGYRPPCRFGRDCQTFIRCETNEKAKVLDEIHMYTFFHPPRLNRFQTPKLPDDFNPMICCGNVEQSEVDDQYVCILFFNRSCVHETSKRPTDIVREQATCSHCNKTF